MDSIAAEYGVCKSMVCLSSQWVEDTLEEDGIFALPGKQNLKKIGLNSLHGGRCDRKLDTPSHKAYYVRKKAAHAEDPAHH